MSKETKISLEEKFHWKNYEKKFPTVRLIIILIELILFALFLIIRFDFVYAIPGGEFAYNGGSILLFYHQGSNGEIIPFVVDQFATAGQTKLSIFYSLLPSMGNFGVSLAVLIAHYVEFANALAIAGISEGLVLFFSISIIVFFTYSLGEIFSPFIRKWAALKRALKERNKFIHEFGDQLLEDGMLINAIKFPQKITPTPKITDEDYKVTYGVIINKGEINFAPVGSDEEKKIYQSPVENIDTNIINTLVQNNCENVIEFAPIE